MVQAARLIHVVRVGAPLAGDEAPSRIAMAGGQLTMVEPADADAFIEAVRQADIIINASRHGFSDIVIRSLRRCRLIVQASVGYDLIDVPAATARGIMVANLPDYCSEEVAEHALALLLACARHLPAMERVVRTGQWNGGPAQAVRATIGPVRRLSASTLGIIGLGTIGRLVARKASGIGWRVLAADPYVTPVMAAKHGVELVSQEELLRQADYVTLHVLLTPTTRHLIGEREFALMKPGAVLVNTCRGPIVDEAALVSALQQRRLGGAGLDVFEEEPLPLDSPLRSLPHVILTPHQAVYSEQALERWRHDQIEEVLRVMAGHWPRGFVNRELREQLSGYRD